MDKTNVMAEFLITGDKLIPGVVTQKLNITPIKTWTKGEEIKVRIPGVENGARGRFNLWEVNTGYEESLNIDDQLLKIFDVLKSKVGVLNELREEYDLKYTICVVVNIENNDKPAMCFDHWFIDFTQALNATIDIDLYIYS